MRFAILLTPSIYASIVSDNDQNDIPDMSATDREDEAVPADVVGIPSLVSRRRVVIVPTTTVDEYSPRETTAVPSTSLETTPVPSSLSSPPIETWALGLGPKFSFGAAQRRGYSNSGAPDGTVAACPTDRDYCIDTRYSDEGTCMYPSPETIKECLDDTCAAHPGNEAIFKSMNEDSYCKDWQKSPEGRVCHWTSDVYCSCPKFSIVYTNAAFVPIGEAAPQGYAVAEICKYADNYKAKNKRAGEGGNDLGPNGQPLQRLQPGQNIVGESTKSQTIQTAIFAVVASCIFVVLF